ncbi:hypothetical protein [Parabacteroides provencensis]|uniref:hypothetical protein n=1 Tax=Parabacteroides provencensis TaxID=1944636 RepID=UPI000C15A328|nr:hypothetical protein [Parabacteroides provencensis]
MPYNFTVTLPCKPYVKCFIEQNYGKPVRFYRDKGVMVIVRLLLMRNSKNLEYRPINKEVYPEVLTFQINEKDYEHYGCYLSNQAIMDLNKYFESKVKTLMRSWCASQHSFGMPAVECVNAFQSKFGFPEHIWKFESIYKDCQRNNVFEKETDRLLSEKIHKIILSQMSKNRTITPQAKLLYEEN